MELRKNRYQYIHHSVFIRKFVNGLSTVGKAYKIEQLLFQSLVQLKFKVRLNPIMLFLFIVNEIRPCIDLRSLRLGSTLYTIPVPLPFRKQLGRSVKLLLQELRESKQRIVLTKKVEIELNKVLQENSPLLKRSQESYQVASNTRAFAHYR
jgi:small subunit ribosomal protein S7